MKYDLNFRNNYGTDQELLDDMIKVSDELGAKKLTSRVYSEYGKLSGETIKKRFEGVKYTLVKAGLEITATASITGKELFESLENVWIGLGKQPGKRDLKKTFIKVF
jgi:hypothetical protein